MNTIKKALVILSLMTCTYIVIPESAEAQCPMCRMTAEGNLKGGGSAGKGLNRGILYMLSGPYILALSLGVVWYRNQKAADREELREMQEKYN